jgi:hypothetical protein
MRPQEAREPESWPLSGPRPGPPLAMPEMEKMKTAKNGSQPAGRREGERAVPARAAPRRRMPGRLCKMHER